MILVPGIKVRDNESFDEAYRRFKKQCDRNLIVTETRARRYFEPNTEIRKKQKISARKKMLKKLYMLRRYESRL
ncbi:MAG TPA: 30S ribosomal protein S21 [Aliarcobacter sp.]|nr:30S ribosomal protein S21 [Aliarcobacter sp.]